MKIGAYQQNGKVREMVTLAHCAIVAVDSLIASLVVPVAQAV